MAVEYRDVSVVYGWGEDAVVALDGVACQIQPQEFVAIIGSSGCGKSTLLHLTADLLPPQFVQGTVLVNGQSPAHARKNNSFAFVFQDPVLAPWRTVYENIRLPLEIVTRQPSRSPEELLRLVGLEGFADRLPGALSGGMRQRVAVARALCLDPQVLLMDEPFGALDELTRERIQVEFLQVWDKTEAAVLMVTHSISEAVFLADRVLIMASRPGWIKKEIAIPFDRPRLPEIKGSIGFLEKENQVRSALEE